jgi:hypothetical protein
LERLDQFAATEGGPSLTLSNWQNVLHNWTTIAQTLVATLTALIAVLGVPLALRQVANLQRALHDSEAQRTRQREAEANLNISAHYSITRPAAVDDLVPQPKVMSGQQQAPVMAPEPPPPPGRRVLRLDLTLENIGEGTVDVLACLVAARELVHMGAQVAAEGRDAQWDDLTRHYWDAPQDDFAPGLSTTKHIVYAPDALARIKARSRKILARVDQVADFEGEKYLLYRVFLAARPSSRTVSDLENWNALQRALLNVNSPAFREVTAEENPLGLLARPEGWRVWLNHYDRLADPQLPILRAQADRQQRAITDPDEYHRIQVLLDKQLQDYVRINLLSAWRAFRADLDKALQDPRGFDALMANRAFRLRNRDVEKQFPWQEQEIWVEYLYVVLESSGVERRAVP